MTTAGDGATTDPMWEHTYLQTSTNDLARLVQTLNDLATDGWELVSTHSADRTVGTNAVTALIRRRIVPLPVPEDRQEGWKPDPSGRWRARHWNGRAWTYHVTDESSDRHRDPPTAREPLQGFME